MIGWYYEKDAPWLAEDLWQKGDFHDVFQERFFHPVKQPLLPVFDVCMHTHAHNSEVFASCHFPSMCGNILWVSGCFPEFVAFWNITGNFSLRHLWWFQNASLSLFCWI